jgi:cephalosporin hydroxylase
MSSMFKKELYERLLQNRTGITLLEIGVYDGDSMLMFESMLLNSRIYGIDTSARPVSLWHSSVITRELNQNHTELLTQFANEVGSFDVVIDDASHLYKETLNSFDVFWQYVAPGGMYVIEDWSIAYAYDSGYYKLYPDRVEGMDKLVFDIALNNKDVSDFEITFKKQYSYAVYYKK